MDYLKESGQRILDLDSFSLSLGYKHWVCSKHKQNDYRTWLEQGLFQVQKDKALGKLPIKLGKLLTFQMPDNLTSVTNPLPKAAALVKSKLVFQFVPLLYNYKNYLWSQKKTNKPKTNNNTQTNKKQTKTPHNQNHNTILFLRLCN